MNVSAVDALRAGGQGGGDGGLVGGAEAHGPGGAVLVVLVGDLDEGDGGLEELGLVEGQELDVAAGVGQQVGVVGGSVLEGRIISAV